LYTDYSYADNNYTCRIRDTTSWADLAEFNLYLYYNIFLLRVDDTEVLELDDVGNSIVEQIISNSNAVKRSGNLTAST